MKEIKIEYASKNQVDFIADCQLAMALETENLILEKEKVSKGVQHIFDNPAKGFYLIATENEIPIAVMLILYEWSDWRNGTVLWIHSLFVERTHRQKNIFKKLYAFVQQIVNSHVDMYGIRLYVEKNNQVAQKAYYKVGMTNVHYELFEWLK